MTPEDKLKTFLQYLPGTYMLESFYSVYKPQAKHIVTIVNTPIEKHNDTYLEAITLAASVYGNEVIPFIINVGTVEVNSEPLTQEEIDELAGIPSPNG